MKTATLLLLCVFTLQTYAQKPVHKTAGAGKHIYNKLYQYGEADAFLGGVYDDTTLSIHELKQHGDFGLGAPDMLDGELVVYDGKAYQTRSTGKTSPLIEKAKTSLSLVTFFKADTVFYIAKAANKKEAFEQIDRYLNKNNASYAIKITGNFGEVKTRAFPPVDKKPYVPLADMLDKQHFFTFENTKGTLVGFKLPPYLNGVSIAGFHFHFISGDKLKGGHMTEFSGSNLRVEIAELHSFEMRIPQTKSYRAFDFNKVRKGDTQKAEQ